MCSVKLVRMSTSFKSSSKSSLTKPERTDGNQCWWNYNPATIFILRVNIFTTGNKKYNDTVITLVSFLVWLVRSKGASKCCREVMHGKCSWNTTRSQRRQEQGGWWCSKRRQKGIAPGRFLKALSSPTHFVTQSTTERHIREKVNWYGVQS